MVARGAAVLAGGVALYLLIVAAGCAGVLASIASRVGELYADARYATPLADARPAGADLAAGDLAAADRESSRR